jgi:DNA-binding GntR family transcriptional regulator
MSLTIEPIGTDVGSVVRGNGRSGRREITERLAARILGHIQSESLGRGDHLASQDLAARFGVSRTPVNQALGLLHSKGVLRHEPNRGYFVGEAKDVAPDAIGLAEGDNVSEAYFALAEDHLRGKLPGQVSESYLRERYHLTRSRLTAVLSRVAQEGWAERRAGYGWAFSPVLSTQESLEQTYRVRLALEPAALLEPGYRLHSEMAGRLRAAEKRLLAGAIETDSVDALHERGVRFHETIVGASGNPFFLATVQRINRVRRLLSYRSMLDRTRYPQHCREHLKILDLLDRERNEEAATALRHHLQGTMRNLRKISALLNANGNGAVAE